MLANCDDSATKDLLVEHGWGEQRVAIEQLYDLVFDPSEARNVADDPANRSVVEELRARLDEWMVERGDPLLDGPVAPPPGAEVNDPDQISPNDPPRAIKADPTVVTSS